MDHTKSSVKKQKSAKEMGHQRSGKGNGNGGTGGGGGKKNALRFMMSKTNTNLPGDATGDESDANGNH